MAPVLSRRAFFGIATLVCPPLGYGIVMLLTDGLQLISGDSALIIVFGLGVPAAVAIALGKIARRPGREIALAVVSSVAASVALAIAIVVYAFSQLPPDYLN